MAITIAYACEDEAHAERRDPVNGTTVYQVLTAKGILELHHANSVTTSATFLSVGGLAYRGYVADHRLAQTPQSSDVIDRRYGIWHDVFMDTVDIHDRASRRNFSGPVLFILKSAVLLSLPNGSEVLVTKKNPTNWTSGEPDSARWYTDGTELSASLSRGTFGQMIVVRTPKGSLPFEEGSVRMLLDDPQRDLSDGPAYAHAKAQLAGQQSKSNVPLSKRNCSLRCQCVNQYTALPGFKTLFE